MKGHNRAAAQVYGNARECLLTTESRTMNLRWIRLFILLDFFSLMRFKITQEINWAIDRNRQTSGKTKSISNPEVLLNEHVQHTCSQRSMTISTIHK